jgi:hypothetical protein
VFWYTFWMIEHPMSLGYAPRNELTFPILILARP